MVKKFTFGVDAKGNPLGEVHHRAKLSDEDVEFIRLIYAEGFCSYSTLALVFGVGKSTIHDIVTFRRRAATPEAYKTVEIEKLRPLPRNRLDQLTGETK